MAGSDAEEDWDDWPLGSDANGNPVQDLPLQLQLIGSLNCEWKIVGRRTVSGEFWMNLRSRFDLLVKQGRKGNSLAKAPLHYLSRQAAAQRQAPYKAPKVKSISAHARAAMTSLG